MAIETIWLAQPSVAIEILTNIGNQGLGWFSLKQIAESGPLDVKRIDAEDADGDAHFVCNAPPAAPGGANTLYFKERVLLASSSQPDAPIFLSVRQAGLILPAMNMQLQVINKKGSSHAAVDVGEQKPLENKPYNFRVWFQ